MIIPNPPNRRKKFVYPFRILIHNTITQKSGNSSKDLPSLSGRVRFHCARSTIQVERKKLFVRFLNLLFYWNNCIVKYVSQAGLPHFCLLSSYRGQRSPTGLHKVNSNISTITATAGAYFSAERFTCDTAGTFIVWSWFFKIFWFLRIFSVPSRTSRKFNKNVSIHDILSSTLSIKLNLIAVANVSGHFSGLETAWRGAIRGLLHGGDGLCAGGKAAALQASRHRQQTAQIHPRHTKFRPGQPRLSGQHGFLHLNTDRMMNSRKIFSHGVSDR